MKNKAFTLIEILVVITIIAILAALAVPAVQSAIKQTQVTQGVHNARQYQMAAQMMTLDGVAQNDPLVWTYRANTLLTRAEYDEELTSRGYISTNELTKLMAGSGTTNSFRVYAIRDGDPGTTPFLISRNWENGALSSNYPYQTFGFVLVTKGGAGFAMKAKQAQTVEPTSTPLAE